VFLFVPTVVELAFQWNAIVPVDGATVVWAVSVEPTFAVPAMVGLVTVAPGSTRNDLPAV